MKKFHLILTALLAAALLSACGGESPAETTLPTDAPTTPATEPATIPATTPAATQPSAPKVIDFRLELPEGFELSTVQDTIQVFSSPDAPKDPSYVSVEVFPRDESVLKMDTADMTQRLMEPGISAVEPQQDSSEYEPFIQYLEDAEVDGFEAVFVDYVQSADDYTSHIYRYEVVTTDANYAFTFCDSTDNNDWLDQFETCSQQIDLVLDTEQVNASYQGLTSYTLSSGLEIYAEDGLQKQDAQGFTDALANENVLILTMSDNKEKNNLTGMSLAGYAELVAQTNQLEPFQTDMYGNLYTTFPSSDSSGLEYYNMLCVKETDDAFWVCQMTCQDDDELDYAKVFPLWASSIN